MAQEIMSKKLFEYNNIIKEQEDLYRKIAKHFGMSECSFWILYSLREANHSLTQSELCYALSQPKQTINSALKKWEDTGYIELSTDLDRRRKLIQLTTKGEFLAQETVDKVIVLENQTFDRFTDSEQKLFLNLLHKYTDNLKKNLVERTF